MVKQHFVGSNVKYYELLRSSKYPSKDKCFSIGEIKTELQWAKIFDLRLAEVAGNKEWFKDVSLPNKSIDSFSDALEAVYELMVDRGCSLASAIDERERLKHKLYVGVDEPKDTNVVWYNPVDDTRLIWSNGNDRYEEPDYRWSVMIFNASNNNPVFKWFKDNYVL